MGKIKDSEGGPRHEALPSTRDIFPVRILPIYRAGLALRDTRNPNQFVLEERERAGSTFDNYLERYYNKFAQAQSNTQNPGVDKLSFFVGATLMHRMLSEQVLDLNNELAEKLKATPKQKHVITLPHFEDSERLFNSEMKSLNYWKAESGHLDSDFGIAASNRLLQLADPELSNTGDHEMNLATAFFYASIRDSDPISFYTGAGATYFAFKNAVAENQQFEQLLKTASKAA